MANYQFLDANSSILTASATDIGGGVLQPIVQLGSALGAVPITFSGSPSISGAVTVVGNASVSGTVGSSIIGQLPAGTALLGSVMVLQGTDPWKISSVYGNFSGSVLSQQLGTNISSVINSNPSSLLVGSYGQRNDAIASFLGGDKTWNPQATDSAGRVLTKAFAPEESRVEGYGSTTSTSQLTLVAAAGTGLRNYITDLWIANTGSVATLVTLKDNAGSILGYTIAPATSGSNLPGLVTPIRTGANAAFDIVPSTATSTLYATVKGFKAP